MLVLASASPRRQELLRNAGIQVVVQASDVPEIPKPAEEPRAYAERLAREKALAVLMQRPNDVVLGADTVVVVDDRILEKPRDAEDAARMLRMLSGREHFVITGVCLAAAQGLKSVPTLATIGTPEGAPFHGAVHDIFLDVQSETTKVVFDVISDDEIRNYIATGEPMDKAGAYAIQGIASKWIPRIEGDYANVVGLPVALVWRMLKEARLKTPRIFTEKT